MPAACHGATGAGDGPNAKGLDPPPIAFIDRARADERSPFALYQVIDQGLDGTAMASFTAGLKGSSLSSSARKTICFGKVS